MSFISLIIKNPFRNKTRAIITILGIAIGLATIVALGAITEGLTASVDETLHAGGSDFSISGIQSDSMQNTAFGTNNINQSWIQTIQNYPGVSKAVGVYIAVSNTTNSPYFSLTGLNKEDTSLAKIKITEGSLYENNKNEIIIGKLTAEEENKKVGDSLNIGNRTYTVKGIYETGDSNQDEGAFTSLNTAQTLMDDPNNITMIFVKVNKGADVKKITNSIDSKYGDNITTISSLNDIKTIKDSMDQLNGATWGISLLAILIGTIGIINTMLMTIFERTKEIGVLKAVGWSDKKILTMILGESIVITVFAGVVGSIIGVIGIELLSIFNILGQITPVFTPKIFIEAFTVAIIVGILGGLYPAIKAVRLPPTEALRDD